MKDPGVCFRQANVCERELWIQRDGLDVKLFGRAIVTLQESVWLQLILPTLQIKIVGAGVFRRLSLNQLFFLG